MRYRSLLFSATLLALACSPSTDDAAEMEAAVEPGLDAAECWRRDAPEQMAERVSPSAEASVRLRGDEMKVCYSQPGARGRTVMGELVPFGMEWRTGANEATAIHLTFPAMIAGVRVDPGSYSLVTVPGESEWGILLNSVHERWGVPIPSDTHVREATATAEAIAEPVESFTIRFEEMGSGAHMILEWVNTRVRIPVERAGE